MKVFVALFLVAICFAGAVMAFPQSSDVDRAQARTTVQERTDGQYIQMGLMEPKACYRCSEPCPNTICCDNTGYPQCCRVNGVCGCCRI